MKESFIFYRSFFESLQGLSIEKQGECLMALADYALNGIERELSPEARMFFTLVKPQVDANIRRYENGMKGGRPKKPKNNLEETKTKPNQNLDETKPEPNDNVNYNYNYNNIYNLNNNINTKTRKENIIKEKNKRYGECQNVILTEDQFNKLSAEHNNLNEAIEKLDTWLGTSGGKNKNKNHYPYFKSNSWVWEGLEKKETSLVDFMEMIKIDENLRFDETMPEFSDMTFEECTRAYEWMQQNMYGKELPRVKFIKIVHKFKNG